MEYLKGLDCIFKKCEELAVIIESTEGLDILVYRVSRVFPNNISNWLDRDWSRDFVYFMVLNEIKEKNHGSLIGNSIAS